MYVYVCKCVKTRQQDAVHRDVCVVCSVIEFRAFVVCYRAKEKGEKTCGIIDAVDNFRLIIQVSSIDDREYRRRRNTPESREATF